MNSGQQKLIRNTRTVSAAFIDTILFAAEQLGLNKQELCQSVDLNADLLEDPSSRVKESVMLSLFDVIVRKSGNKDFGLMMGQHSRPGTYSALGYAIMNCANLSEAFELIPRYEDVVMEIGRTRIERQGNQVKLIWGTQNNTPCPRALIDSILSSWMFLAHWLTGKNTLPDITLLSYPKPSDQSAYRKLFGRDIRFSCTENAFIFCGATFLDEKILQADLAMNQIMTQRMISLKAQLDKERPLSQSIIATLNQKLPLGMASLSDIARELNSSERTLRRRLKEEGSSYQELLANLRHQLACTYLADPSLSILDITLLLGYSEHSSFTAAFKNWQGETPISYRQQHVNESAQQTKEAP